MQLPPRLPSKIHQKTFLQQSLQTFSAKFIFLGSNSGSQILSALRRAATNMYRAGRIIHTLMWLANTQPFWSSLSNDYKWRMFHLLKLRQHLLGYAQIWLQCCVWICHPQGSHIISSLTHSLVDNCLQYKYIL